MRRPKLKCADCGQRWVPAEDIDEDEAVAAVQEEVRAARNPAPEPEIEPELVNAAPAAPERPRGTLGKWALAVVLGAAFTTASAGLWIGRIDPEAVPGVGALLAQIAPPPPQLDVRVAGSITRLPGGDALLEVTGSIANPGQTVVAVPALNARLLIGGAACRSWTIPPPAAVIKPGQRLIFASSITDVPVGPIIVQVRFARRGLQL